MRSPELCPEGFWKRPQSRMVSASGVTMGSPAREMFSSMPFTSTVSGMPASKLLASSGTFCVTCTEQQAEIQDFKTSTTGDIFNVILERPSSLSLSKFI